MRIVVDTNVFISAALKEKSLPGMAVHMLAEPVTITHRITACRDPKDDKFLAVNGHADLIVAGDADLLALHPFRGIPIVTAAAFVQGIRDKSRYRPPHVCKQRRIEKEGSWRNSRASSAPEFVHIDYGAAIRVLDRANEKFEFPVKWGIDLQSEHERYLTAKYAKKPVIVKNYPKAIKAFYMRVNDDGRTVVPTLTLPRLRGREGWGLFGAGDRRDHRRPAARGAAQRLGPQYGRARHRPGALRLVPRPAPLRHGAAPSLTLPACGGGKGRGLGFERTLAYVAGLANVRDAIPLGRAPGNARY